MKQVRSGLPRNFLASMTIQIVNKWSMQLGQTVMAPLFNSYAVRQGRQPGIYTTWDGARAQVHGYSSAVYKGFLLLENAKRYMRGKSVVMSTSSISCRAFRLLCP